MSHILRKSYLVFPTLTIWLFLVVGCNSSSPPIAVEPTATNEVVLTNTATPLPTATHTPFSTDTPTPKITSTKAPATNTPTASTTATSSATTTPSATATPSATTTPSDTPTLLPTLVSTVGISQTFLSTVPDPTFDPVFSLTLPDSWPCDCPIEHVVIITIDGLRADALPEADTPILDTVRAHGTFHPTARAVVPSVTLVNHASILGGMTPENHGIMWNINDPALGLIKGPTLFSAAKAYSLTTGMIYAKPKLEHIVLTDSVDSLVHAGYHDTLITASALNQIEAGLPNVLFIHLPNVDSAGHLMGWMSKTQLWALETTDSYIGAIILALDQHGYLDRTLVIITSDHGGVDHKHGADTPEETIIPWFALGPNLKQGLELNEPLFAYDTAPTAAHALGIPIPPEWDGQPVLDIFFHD
ncbi:alkaline phosphatase family protein [Anaerolineales bacterium HSG6]|nr:alkaline phosphatase family protein [Anaerolineales bacterium HSG6]